MHYSSSFFVRGDRSRRFFDLGRIYDTLCSSISVIAGSVVLYLLADYIVATETESWKFLRKRIDKSSIMASPTKPIALGSTPYVYEISARERQELEEIGLELEREEAFQREINARLFDLPLELQGEVFSWMKPQEAKEWLSFRPTYQAARARYWKDGVKLKTVEETSKFCNFIAAERSQHVRALIQELTFIVPEPRRQAYPADKVLVNPKVADLGCYIERAWYDLVPRVETMLSQLSGLITAVVHTFRPHKLESPIGSADLTPMRLPDQVQELRLNEPKPFDPDGDVRPRLVGMFSMLAMTPQAPRKNIWSTSNIKLFTPGSNLKSLTFISAVKVVATNYSDHEYGGGGMGLDGLGTYSNVQKLSLRVGSDAREIDPIADGARILRNLRLLPQLHTLEIMSRPCSQPGFHQEKSLASIFEQGWLAALPTLQVLRVPIRSILELASKTRAHNALRLELIVSNKELAAIWPWVEDWDFIYVFLKLAEECAHYYTTHPDDHRTLKLRPVHIRDPDDINRDDRFIGKGDFDPTNSRYNRNDSMVYYPDQPDYDPCHLVGSMHGLREYLNSQWSGFIRSMPGFSTEQGDLAVIGDEDVYDAFRKIGKWEPRCN